MTGGMLQLVAYGVQDIFLTNDPQISFFKTVYRRHTNFSREEFDLKFNNTLDFGKEAICKIQRYGDLLHRLFLVINLPIINAKYNNVTVGQVLSLTKANNIKWDVSLDHKCKFNIASYKDLSKIIKNTAIDHQKQINTLNIIKNAINGNSNNNHNNIILEHCDDHIKNLYNFTLTKLNNEQSYFLYNANEIKNILVTKIFDYIVPNKLSYNYENLKFVYNLESCNNSSQFGNKLNNIYGNFIPTQLDAYKIYNLYKNKLNGNTSVQHIMKTKIINNILFTLNNNPQILLNIYNSIINNIKFVFYRNVQNKKNNNKNNNLIFHNMSQLNYNSCTQFSDGITYTLNNNHIDPNMIYPFNNYMNESIKIFHNDNTNIFNNKYFNEYFTDIKLWVRTNLIGPGDKYLDA